MRGDAGFTRTRRAESPERKLTQPLRIVVVAFGAFTVALLTLSFLTAASSSHISIYGLGSTPVCADVPLNGISQTGTASMGIHMRAGASSGTAGAVSMCVDKPTLGQRLLVTLAQAPTAALYLALLLLLWQLLRAVQSAGPFDLLIARRLRFLAWFILGGSLVVAAGQSTAASIFASTAVADPVPVVGNAVIAAFNAFPAPLLIACGLLTLARVIRVGARMNDDLAGTV